MALTMDILLLLWIFFQRYSLGLCAGLFGRVLFVDPFESRKKRIV
jgi:hypothetical protein